MMWKGEKIEGINVPYTLSDFDNYLKRFSNIQEQHLFKSI
jgi:hypothetical protein